MLKFEIGKTYSHNFVCDSGCWVDWTVLKRTAKTVTIESRGRTFRRAIKTDDRYEYCLPTGSYSMAPILTAEKGR